MTDHIEQQNDVEGFAAIQFIHINGLKFDVWMARHCLFDHCGAEIKPQAALTPKLDTQGEPFDIGRIAWGAIDPSILSDIFHGRTIGRTGNSNWSYFNSAKYNRLLDKAARLTGDKRYRAYQALDLQLSRDAAPAIPVTILNAFTFVSARVGCVVVNPNLKLTAVCLK